MEISTKDIWPIELVKDVEELVLVYFSYKNLLVDSAIHNAFFEKIYYLEKETSNDSALKIIDVIKKDIELIVSSSFEMQKNPFDLLRAVHD